jgi:hypothetical protein
MSLESSKLENLWNTVMVPPAEQSGGSSRSGLGRW